MTKTEIYEENFKLVLKMSGLLRHDLMMMKKLMIMKEDCTELKLQLHELNMLSITRSNVIEVFKLSANVLIDFKWLNYGTFNSMFPSTCDQDANFSSLRNNLFAI